MQLPRWVRHPYATLRETVPSRREIMERVLSSRRGRIGVVAAVYGVLFGFYHAGAVPYPATGEEGVVAFYELSKTQQGAIAWFMIGGAPAYIIAEKAISMVYSPDENILRVLDPEGEIEETWKLGDEMLADMTVEDGPLATRQTAKGKVWYCRDYNPEENVAKATWEGTVDAGQVWTTKQQVAKCLTETQERAREADRLEREQPEIVRESTRAEMRRWIEKMDDVDPIVSGEGYREARADALGLDYEDDGGERDEELRRQEDEQERTNGKADEVVGMSEAMPDGGDE